MRNRLVRVVLLAMSFGLASEAGAQFLPRSFQTPASPLSQLSSGETSAAVSQPGERQVSLKTIVPNILHDQRPIWTFPLRVAEGHHLAPTIAVVAATAGLVALDPYDEPYFRNSSGFKNFKTGALRGRNTTLGITLTPVATYLIGLDRGDSYARHTALLAAEGLADTQILTLAMKGMDGRLHPSDIPPHGDFTHTWFKWSGTVTNPASFPSGHASSAFAVATVFAHRYREHRWVPWVAYGAATFVSLTRIPDQAHFPSDVFAGAAIGYVVSRFVVLRH